MTTTEQALHTFAATFAKGRTKQGNRRFVSALISKRRYVDATPAIAAVSMKAAAEYEALLTAWQFDGR